MAEAAHRMRPMRERRRARALRELRLIVPDPIPGPFGDGSLGSSPAWTEQRRECYVLLCLRLSRPQYPDIL